MSNQICVVRAGRDATYLQDFLEKKPIAIGWNEVGNLHTVTSRDAIAALLNERMPGCSKPQQSMNAGQIYRFRQDLLSGQTVMTYDPGNRLYHVGTVAGDYQFRPDLSPSLQHTRAMNWTGTVERDALSPETRNSLSALATIFCVSQAAADEIRSLLEGKPPQPDTVVATAMTRHPEAEQQAETDIRKDTEQRALEFLQDRLAQVSWDDMQELVAGLLRAMGYKTRVSPPGADRGRDIVASPDGFGFQTPRIVVEVKHRKGAMGAPEIRAFAGGLRHDDNGLYVSTGGLSREAKYEADRANHHVALMDSADLGKAIVEHYDHMDAEAKTILPLKKIYWPI